MRYASKQIPVESFQLSRDEIRVLVDLLFSDGWLSKADLIALSCLWNDIPTERDDEVIAKVFQPAFAVANAAFNTLVATVSEKLGLELSDKERELLKFPHGAYFNENRAFLGELWSRRMQELNQFLS